MTVALLSAGTVRSPFLPSVQPHRQRAEARSQTSTFPGQRDDFSSSPTQGIGKRGKMTPEEQAALGRHHFLSLGRRGDEVRELQTLLEMTPTGVFDEATAAAVMALQEKNGLRPDGTVGQQTWGLLLGIAGVEPGTWFLQPDISCTVTSYRNRDRLNQMTLGTIVVNGHTYQFRNGGHGRGSIPFGDYNVTPHLWSRSEPSAMVVDGVGWSFAVSDKWDDRVGDTRTLLRIHPDGASEGTEGCVGIVGGGEVQKRFREDMRAALERLGGSLTMRMGTTPNPLTRA